MNEECMYQICHDVFSEMRRSGITSVGEFHYVHHSRSNQQQRSSTDTAADPEVPAEPALPSYGELPASCPRGSADDVKGTDSMKDGGDGNRFNYNFDQVVMRAAADCGLRLVLLNAFYK